MQLSPCATPGLGTLAQKGLPLPVEEQWRNTRTRFITHGFLPAEIISRVPRMPLCYRSRQSITWQVLPAVQHRVIMAVYQLLQLCIYNAIVLTCQGCTCCAVHCVDGSD